MPRKNNYQETIRHPKEFKGAEEIQRAIGKLNQRVSDVKDLDASGSWADENKVSQIGMIVRETIRGIYGADSCEFERWEHWSIWSGPRLMGMSQREINEAHRNGIPEAIAKLEGEIKLLEEKHSEFQTKDGLEKDEVIKRYDTAQICMNGHVSNPTVEAFPDGCKDFCSECGKQTLSRCPSCNYAISGALLTKTLHASRNFTVSPYTRPAYCQYCGKAYPWTEAALAAAESLADELDELTPEQRDILKKSLPEISHPNPNQELAKNRLGKLIKGVSEATGEVIKKMIIEVGAEALKKSMGL